MLLNYFDEQVFEKFAERFYLLCPTTGYAGDYIWKGDAQSGCVEILRYNKIAADQWQLGTSKIFIKNPETVSSSATMCKQYIEFQLMHGKF